MLSPSILNEIEGLLQNVESEKVNTAAREVKDFVVSNFPMIGEEQLDTAIQDLLSSFQGFVLQASLSIISLAQSMFSLIIQIIMIPLVAFFY